MAFTIPDNDEAFNTNQAIWMQSDIDALVAGHARTGVVSGCAVSAQGSPDMTVAVAAGVVLFSGQRVTVAAGNVTITTANGTNPRIDLIVVNSSGTKSCTAGVAAANPKPVDIPASSVLLAMVYVPANDTTMASNQITDKRVLIDDSAFSGILNARDYGALGDVRSVTDGVIATSGNHVTSATAVFTAADVGKTIAAFGGQTAIAEVQSLIATSASAGNFTITYSGEASGNIAWNASAATVQTALEAMTAFAPGDITCTGGPLPNTAVVMTFAGARANFPHPLMTASATLTGGTPVITRTATGRNTTHITTVATIVSATQITLTAAPTAAVASGATIELGTDDTTAIAALYTALAVAGGVAYFPKGTYYTTQDLQLPSNSVTMGDGMDLTTIKLKPGIYSAANTSIGGVSLVTLLAASQTNMQISQMTFDGNNINTGLCGVGSLSGIAATSHLIDLRTAARIVIERVRVINAVKWSIHLYGCTDISVTGCYVVNGTTTNVYDQQDGIHTTNCLRAILSYNNVDTGTSGDGDDAIIVRCVTPAVEASDISIVGNILRSGQRAVALVSDGQTVSNTGNVSNVSVAGNTVWYSRSSAVILNYYSTGGIFTNVSITGNSFENFSQVAGAGHGINVQRPAAATDGFNNLTITGNSFRNMVSTTNAAVGVSQGRGLVLASNVFRQIAGSRGIALWDFEAPVIDFAITGNWMDFSACASGSIGILAGKCSQGVIADNTILGNLTGGTNGIYIIADATNVATDIVIIGNRITTYTVAIAEVNSGANPDFNTLVANNVRGCTNAYTILGANSTAFQSEAAKWLVGFGSGGAAMLHIKSNAAALIPFIAQHFASASVDMAQFRDSGGTPRLSVDKLGRLTTNTATTTIAAGAAAGSSPSAISITNGTDHAGLINFTTGTATTTNATIVTVTFSAAHATAPRAVIVKAANVAAEALTVAGRPFVDSAGTSTTTFVLKSGATAMTVSTAFKYWYWVIW